MVDIQPQANIPPLRDNLQTPTTRCYLDLIHRPVLTMQNSLVKVYRLPDVADGTEVDLWFAVGEDPFVGQRRIAIDTDPLIAWQQAMGDGPVPGSIKKPMVVSPMRSFLLADQRRYEATPIVRMQDITADLWVTEAQSGCTVLILKWSEGAYSMVHMQPSDDPQFNGFGQWLMSLDGYIPDSIAIRPVRKLYKNIWLKQDMTSVLGSTGPTGRSPLEYIMVQSMFDEGRGHVQVLGVRAGRVFNFYRQREANGYRAEALRWKAWSSWLPYSAY